VLFFASAVIAQPTSNSLGELLVGKAAFGDWRTDAPLVRRKITELPPPYATRSASNFPRVIAKPASAAPKVPPGFTRLKNRVRSTLFSGRTAQKSRPIDPVFRADSVVLAISVVKDGNLRVVYARIGRRQGHPAWRGA
jgi:hypothetical protein